MKDVGLIFEFSFQMERENHHKIQCHIHTIISSDSYDADILEPIFGVYHSYVEGILSNCFPLPHTNIIS